MYDPYGGLPRDEAQEADAVANAVAAARGERLDPELSAGLIHTIRPPYMDFRALVLSAQALNAKNPPASETSVKRWSRRALLRCQPPFPSTLLSEQAIHASTRRPPTGSSAPAAAPTAPTAPPHNAAAFPPTPQTSELPPPPPPYPFLSKGRMNTSGQRQTRPWYAPAPAPWPPVLTQALARSVGPQAPPPSSPPTRKAREHCAASTAQSPDSVLRSGSCSTDSSMDGGRDFNLAAAQATLSGT